MKNTNLMIEEAKLTSVNLSTEGNEENPVSRTDLDFSGLADMATFAKLIGSTKTAEAFWDKEGNLEALGITAITSRAEMKDCTMKFFGETVKDVKVKKFRVKPISRHSVQISLQCQVHHTDKQLAMFDKWQRKTDKLEIETTQGDLFDQVTE